MIRTALLKKQWDVEVAGHRLAFVTMAAIPEVGRTTPGAHDPVCFPKDLVI